MSACEWPVKYTITLLRGPDASTLPAATPRAMRWVGAQATAPQRPMHGVLAKTRTCRPLGATSALHNVQEGLRRDLWAVEIDLDILPQVARAGVAQGALEQRAGDSVPRIAGVVVAHHEDDVRVWHAPARKGTRGWARRAPSRASDTHTRARRGQPHSPGFQLTVDDQRVGRVAVIEPVAGALHDDGPRVARGTRVRPFPSRRALQVRPSVEVRDLPRDRGVQVLCKGAQGRVFAMPAQKAQRPCRSPRCSPKRGTPRNKSGLSNAVPQAARTRRHAARKTRCARARLFIPMPLPRLPRAAISSQSHP